MNGSVEFIPDQPMAINHCCSNKRSLQLKVSADFSPTALLFYRVQHKKNEVNIDISELILQHSSIIDQLWTDHSK